MPVKTVLNGTHYTFVSIFLPLNRSVEWIRDNPDAMRDLAQRILLDPEGFAREVRDSLLGGRDDESCKTTRMLFTLRLRDRSETLHLI